MNDPDELLSLVCDGVVVVTPRGRPFVRAIAAHFDAYLDRGTARHSVAI